VHVRHQPVAALDRGDQRVRGVGYVAGPLPVRGAGTPMPPGEHRLALVGLHVEVQYLPVRDGAEPGDVPVSPRYQQATLAHAGALVGLVPQEDVRRDPVRAAQDGDGKARRLQVAGNERVHHGGDRPWRCRRRAGRGRGGRRRGTGPGMRPCVADDTSAAQPGQPGNGAADEQVPPPPAPVALPVPVLVAGLISNQTRVNHYHNPPPRSADRKVAY